MRNEAPLESVPPRRLFGALPDNEWRWLHIDGVDRCPFLASYLPSLPAELLQRSISAASGTSALTAAFEQYRFFKQIYEKHSGSPLATSHHVLDFGCGWGRVIRFFLRDVDPENLWGVDVSESALAACRETNRWCRFESVAVLPPSDLPDHFFDLVYAWSVFSHLSEEAHERWLVEFGRVLKPRGVLILTTLPRSFIEFAASLDQHESAALPSWQRRAASCFSPRNEWLDAYDRGGFCFCPIESSNPHFGFTCIPERYIREFWSRHFVVRDYIQQSDSITQDVIVCVPR